MHLSHLDVSLSPFISLIPVGGERFSVKQHAVLTHRLSHPVCAPFLDCILFSVLLVSCPITSMCLVVFAKPTAGHSNALGPHIHSPAPPDSPRAASGPAGSILVAFLSPVAYFYLPLLCVTTQVLGHCVTVADRIQYGSTPCRLVAKEQGARAHVFGGCERVLGCWHSKASPKGSGLGLHPCCHEIPRDWDG